MQPYRFENIGIRELQEIQPGTHIFIPMANTPPGYTFHHTIISKKADKEFCFTMNEWSGVKPDMAIQLNKGNLKEF